MKNKTPTAAIDAGVRQAVGVKKPARAKAVVTKPVTKPRGTSEAKAKRDPLVPGSARKPPKPSKKIEVRLLIDDLARLDALKQRAAAAGRRSKRSELLRAGLVLLQGLDPLSLCDALEALPVRRKAKSLPLPSLVAATGKKRKR